MPCEVFAVAIPAAIRLRFRFESGPGMRITTTGLGRSEAGELGDAIAEAVESPGGTYSA